MADDLVKMTVEIPRSLWRSAKIRAAEQDRGLRDVVIESLERYLASSGGESQTGKKGGSRGVR
jgi:hypothetical protein